MNACDLVLYTDMDGTALSDWERGPYVPELSLRLLRRFTEEGGLFAVASGRQEPEISRFFQGIPMGAPLVCGNGSVIFDSVRRQVLRRIDLPRIYQEQCVDYFLSHRDVWIVVGDERGVYQVSSGDPEKDAGLTDWKRPFISVEEFLSRPFVKVVYIAAEGVDVERLKAEVSALPGGELVAGAQSGPRYYEMMKRGVSKAEGIRWARKTAGLEDRTLVCIGDYFNDLAMLQAADIAACPSNAADGIKAICSIHTCSNNEGALGDLLRQLLGWS